MAHPMTLPILAGIAVLGTVGGVQLGRSAVAEINPAYFGDPPDSFHGDLVPYRSPDWAQVQAREYQQAEPIQGLGSGCIGCRDYPVEYIPRTDPGVEPYEDGWAASAAYEAQPAVLAEEAPAPDPRMERLRSYSSYPITAEEQESQARAEPAPEPEDEAESEPVAL